MAAGFGTDGKSDVVGKCGNAADHAPDPESERLVAANPERLPVDSQILGHGAVDLGELDFEIHLQRSGDPQLVLDRHAFGERAGGEPERAIGGGGGVDLAGQRHPAGQAPRTHPVEVGLAGQKRAQRLEIQRDRDDPLVDPFVVVQHHDGSASHALPDDVDQVRREQPHIRDLRRGDQHR